ncbi:hypothetical protein ACP70R_038006 [Stipagrostis hirtigluma subsp. patula]
MELVQHEQRVLWADAPPDVLGLIVGRLPILADRFRFGAVCRPWHAAERLVPRPGPLPWLALSLPASPTADRAAFYSLSGKAVHQLPFPAGGGVCARVCGSADDWLVVAHRKRGNFLFNPFAGATLPLPHQRTITRSYVRRGNHSMVEYYPRGNQREPYIRKAVLSRPPDVDDPGRCVVATIADSGELFFCRPGQSSWRRPRMRDYYVIRYRDQVEDITFYNGRLYVVVKSVVGRSYDSVRVFDVDEDADKLVVSRNGGGFVRKLHDIVGDESVYADEEAPHHPLHPLPRLERRYLVESRGRLLMVERHCWRHGRRTTHTFRVFSRAPVPVLPEGYRRPIRPWMPLESLDGEVLFLGGSGSRSFAASELEGGDDDGDCIYFTDDRYPEEERNSPYSMRDDWYSICYDDPRRSNLPCHDIGRYSMRDESVTFLKDLAPNQRRSPPTWLYLSDQRR